MVSGLGAVILDALILLSPSQNSLIPLRGKAHFGISLRSSSRGKAHQKACASARVQNSIALLSGIDGGEHGDCAPMARWLDYDPIALVVLMFGIGAVVLLALII
jgi:hypothetical protein